VHDQPVRPGGWVKVHQMIWALERVWMLGTRVGRPVVHRVAAVFHVPSNVEVTGTLRQGAARCRISNSASRRLAATCPSRLTC